jgi:hypothetical protein
MRFCIDLVAQRYPLLNNTDDNGYYNKNLLELSGLGHYHSGPGDYYRADGDDDMSCGAAQRRAQMPQKADYYQGGLIPHLKSLGDIMVTREIDLVRFNTLLASLQRAIAELDRSYTTTFKKSSTLTLFGSEGKGSTSEAEEPGDKFKNP